MIAIVRLVLLVCLILFGLVVGLLSFMIPGKLFRSIAQLWHKIVVSVVGVRCEVSGESPATGVLMVGNHISWLDITVMGSVCDAVFLSKREVRSWPVLGYLVSRAGTLFIDRGSGAAAATELVGSTLERGQSVFIFPEGRTTDGLAVRKFHSRLFQAAVNSESGVQPVALAYLDASGKFTATPSYSGDRSFLESVWHTLKTGGIRARVHVFPVLAGQETRAQLAKDAEAQVVTFRESL